MTSQCEFCYNYEYDEEYEEYTCQVMMDEDDAMRLMSDRSASCPFYRSGDEYQIVKKQI